MIKEKIQSSRECFADAFSLPKDVALKATLIHIVGKNDVFVENYKGIISYTYKEIVIKGYNSKIVISGNKLMIDYYTDEDMKIKGIINGVKIE